jgi:pyruvate dehydrogenase E1 component beta subunit
MMMVHKVLRATGDLERQGIQLEIIDPRTLVPFDSNTILHSVKKTRRLLIATEDGWRNGSGAGIAAMLSEEVFPFLGTGIRRLAAKDIPIPYGRVLEGAALPQEENIICVAKEMVFG